MYCIVHSIMLTYMYCIVHTIIIIQFVFIFGKVSKKSFQVTLYVTIPTPRTKCWLIYQCSNFRISPHFIETPQQPVLSEML